MGDSGGRELSELIETSLVKYLSSQVLKFYVSTIMFIYLRKTVQ